MAHSRQKRLSKTAKEIISEMDMEDKRGRAVLVIGHCIILALIILFLFVAN